MKINGRSYNKNNMREAITNQKMTDYWPANHGTYTINYTTNILVIARDKKYFSVNYTLKQNKKIYCIFKKLKKIKTNKIR
jgi:hypothetical protein